MQISLPSLSAFAALPRNRQLNTTPPTQLSTGVTSTSATSHLINRYSSSSTQTNQNQNSSPLLFLYKSTTTSLATTKYSTSQIASLFQRRIHSKSSKENNQEEKNKNDRNNGKENTLQAAQKNTPPRNRQQGDSKDGQKVFSGEK